MATLLAFHILGLYPVPSTSQYLVLSPMTPQYTIHNAYLNVSTMVTVANFDPASVAQTIPDGVAAYVESVTINGEELPSRCHLDFYDAFRLGGNITITLTADKAAAEKLKATGNAQMSSKKYDDAIKSYTQAIALDPTNAVYYSNRAAAYSSKGEHSSAVLDAEKAIEADPSFVKAYHRLGCVCPRTSSIPSRAR